jgi:hypothetical protein
MKKLISLIFVFAVCSHVSFAQKAKPENWRMGIREKHDAAAEMKKETADAARVASPADFNDTDSFGKNAKFLGSLYAGTLYVYRSCDAQVLQAELGLVLAADDHCLVHNSVTPLATTSVFDPVWQITIPARSVDNVIYPMLNSTIGWDAFASDPGPPVGNNGYGPGFASITFTPVVTIESDALNDPGAVHPVTGLPLNGSYTAALPGTRFKSFVVHDDDLLTDNESYASVGGRGFSRVYFAALGLPQNVINQLFRRSMTLKFGIRADVNGPIQAAYFSYTFRLLGN